MRLNVVTLEKYVGNDFAFATPSQARVLSTFVTTLFGIIASKGLMPEQFFKRQNTFFTESLQCGYVIFRFTDKKRDFFAITR